MVTLADLGLTIGIVGGEFGEVIGLLTCFGVSLLLFSLTLIRLKVMNNKFLDSSVLTSTEGSLLGILTVQPLQLQTSKVRQKLRFCCNVLINLGKSCGLGEDLFPGT